MKTLLAGWFSFEQCNVTAGDLLDLPSSSSARVWCDGLDKSLLEPPRLTIKQIAVHKARTFKKKAIYTIVKWLLGNKKSASAY